jgi:peptide-methionine (S)-S-oxide reductase
MENSSGKSFRLIMALGAAALVGGSALYLSQNQISAIDVAYAAEGKTIAAPRIRMSESSENQVAVFAGGCFWGIEGVFERVDGVVKVESGYAGGSKGDADYDKVSNGLTKHAEAVRIVYDPARITFPTLLHIFFSVAHDPTQLNKQGPDTGKQYRSAIFPTTETQGYVAKGYIDQLTKAKTWPKPIVTRIESGEFYPAEEYHQDYMQKNPDSGYIRRFDVPKVQALKQYFPNIYRGK